MRQIAIYDCQVVDMTDYRLEKSVRLGCSHRTKECLSTSESGSNTCFAQFRCVSCNKIWTEELLPAEYERLIADAEIL